MLLDFKNSLRHLSMRCMNSIMPPTFSVLNQLSVLESLDVSRNAFVPSQIFSLGLLQPVQRGLIIQLDRDLFELKLKKADRDALRSHFAKAGITFVRTPAVASKWLDFAVWDEPFDLDGDDDDD